MSDRFDELYRSAAGWRQVAPALRPLLKDIYTLTGQRPPDLDELRGALERMLEYLASESGRTDANCCAVDAFFSVREGWEWDWRDLPPDFASLLDDLGGALHDAIYAPQIAATFDSLPEQLLDRARRLG